MRLNTESYSTQRNRWPKTGRHILAQYDDNSIVVYQAYRPAIGHFAASRGYLGGEFRLKRMSWIKPNFLWMMYRSGWGSKSGQEVILAVTIKREAFDKILAAAVHSHYVPEVYDTESEWKIAVQRSPVCLQWDPDRAAPRPKAEIAPQEVEESLDVPFNSVCVANFCAITREIGYSALKISPNSGESNTKLSKVGIGKIY